MGNHIAILKARKYSKRYCFATSWMGDEWSIKETNGKELENPIIWEGTLESPHLKENERLHVAELDRIVTINSSMRSTDGSVIYQTDYEFDLIENEDTEASKLEAEKQLANHEEWIKENKRLEKLRDEELKLENEMNWWQRLFNTK